MSRAAERLAALLLVAGTASADTALLAGPLGNWLDATAAPELAETLSRHPRFKGETVRLVAMGNGAPKQQNDRLTQAVEQRLTQQLLRHDGVRLAWGDDAEPCAVPEPVPYLIGVDIQAAGASRHRLSIAVVDVAEGVWVSGVSLDWQGRLSAAERRALATPVESGAPGSAANPLTVGNGSRIGKLMAERVRCALPGGLDGPLHLRAPEDPRLAAVAGALGRRLAVAPVAPLTPDAASAAWVVGLRARHLDTGSQILSATLEPARAGSAAPRELASLFVTGLAVPPAAHPDVDGRPHGPGPAPRLVGTLAVTPAANAGVCDARRARVNACAEVSFEVLKPAYLVVFSTQQQQLRSLSCDTTVRRTQPGERRYRVRVPPGGASGAPDAGVYVLAVADRELARRVARLVNRGPGACGAHRGSDSLEGWLAELDTLIRRHAERVQWRAAHVRHAPGGVVQL